MWRERAASQVTRTDEALGRRANGKPTANQEVLLYSCTGLLITEWMDGWVINNERSV